MEYPFNNQTEETSPAPQNNPEPTSEHAPLPIGCAPLDEEERRRWDNFCRQGKERDKASEEARQRRKEQQEKKETAPAEPMQKQPKQETKTLSPMEMFQARIAYRQAPVYRKVNYPAEIVEKYLTVAYIQECAARRTTAVLDSETTSAIANVARWLSKDTVTKSSLILRGYIGVGKTTMLRAICTLFIGLNLGGFRIVSAFELAEYAKNRELFSQLKTADYLAIDDLGQEPYTIKDYGNERSPFEELMSARYDKLKQTIISTNLVVVDNKDQIEERYGSRIADRLREMCNVINYDPNKKSYRK